MTYSASLENKRSGIIKIMKKIVFIL